MAQHVNSEHIGKIIDNQEAASVRKAGLKREELKDKKHIRLTNCVAGIVLLIVCGLLWGFLPADRLDSLKEIAKSVVLILGGGAGGYGLALKKQNDEKKD